MSKEQMTAAFHESDAGSFEAPSPFVPVSEVPDEQLPTVHIEDERLHALEICGTKRAKDSPGTIDRHIRGVKGEFAVAKYYGDPEKVDTEILEYGDGGIDLEILDPVQVKTCGPEANNPMLLVNARDQLQAKFYILVQELSRCTYRIMGYAPRLTVAHAPVRLFQCNGYAERLRAVEQCDLWQPPQPVYAKVPI